MTCEALRKLWADLFPKEEQVKIGSTGEGVQEVQALLGFGNTDGVYGAVTERAVKDFQAKEGLFPSGEVDDATLKVLRDHNAPKAPSFEDMVFFFPEALYQTYKLVDAQTPAQPRGVSLKSHLVGKQTINCTQFTTWIVSSTFNTRFTSSQWASWQISADAAETGQVPNFGPRVALEWGIASTRPGEEGPWLVQYFSDPKTFKGHSLLVVAWDKETDKILTLEANKAYGLNGVGWGEIGNLRDVMCPGPDWTDKVTQTWESRLGSKPALHIAQLSMEPNSIQGWLEKG